MRFIHHTFVEVLTLRHVSCTFGIIFRARFPPERKCKAEIDEPFLLSFIYDKHMFMWVFQFPTFTSPSFKWWANNTNLHFSSIFLNLYGYARVLRVRNALQRKVGRSSTSFLVELKSTITLEWCWVPMFQSALV